MIFLLMVLLFSASVCGGAGLVLASTKLLQSRSAALGCAQSGVAPREAASVSSKKSGKRSKMSVAAG